MGSYYRAVVEINGVKEVFCAQVDGEWIGARLMEHSYWGNPFVLAIASKIWKKKGRVAWVGDSSDATVFNWKPAFENVFDKNIEKDDLEYNGFRLEGKVFINHSKKLVLNLDMYRKKYLPNDNCINPIALLTAVRDIIGMSDFDAYFGKELVGSWAWDVVEITDLSIYEWKHDEKYKKSYFCLNDMYSEYTDITRDAYMTTKEKFFEFAYDPTWALDAAEDMACRMDLIDIDEPNKEEFYELVELAHEIAFKLDPEHDYGRQED